MRETRVAVPETLGLLAPKHGRNDFAGEMKLISRLARSIWRPRLQDFEAEDGAAALQIVDGTGQIDSVDDVIIGMNGGNCGGHGICLPEMRCFICRLPPRCGRPGRHAYAALICCKAVQPAGAEDRVREVLDSNRFRCAIHPAASVLWKEGSAFERRFISSSATLSSVEKELAPGRREHQPSDCFSNPRTAQRTRYWRSACAARRSGLAATK